METSTWRYVTCLTTYGWESGKHRLTASEFQFGRFDDYLKAEQRAGSASDNSTGERHE